MSETTVTGRFSVNPALKPIVQEQLDGIVSRPADAPSRPITTVRSTALHDLQLRATVEGHSFIADEAQDKGGHDAGPAPMRYFLAGVLMCHQVWTIKAAAIRDVELTHLEGTVSGYAGPAPGAARPDARIIDRITYEIDIESPNPSADVAAVVDEGMVLCPVVGTTLQGARIEVTVRHGETVVLERTYGVGQ